MSDPLADARPHADLEAENRRLSAELERTREMLLQSAKLAELGRQVAQLVHDLNQPLVGIKAFAQMLRKRLADDAASARKAAFIEEQAVVLEQLVGHLRRYSRTAEFSRDETVDLGEAVETALAVLKPVLRQAGAVTEVDLPRRLPAVQMGAVHVQQLLVNLVSNAAHAVEGRAERRVRISGRQEGGRLRLLVGDSGGGIAPEHLARIFDPFYTTKEPDRGTGLGLPICQEIVRAYGGRLEAVSGEEAEALGGAGINTVLDAILPAAEGSPHGG